MCHLVKYSVHIEWMITTILRMYNNVLIQLHNYDDTRSQREIYMKERNILLHPLRSIQDNWRSNFTHLSYVSPFGNS